MKFTFLFLFILLSLIIPCLSSCDNTNSCIECSDKIVNCSQCKVDSSNGNVSCVNCSNGLVLALDNLSCFECNNRLPQCKSCQFFNGDLTCIECNTGFYKNSNISCLPCLINCVECKEALICSKCEVGYTLDPISLNCVKLIPNCSTFQYDNITGSSFCENCEPMFGMKENDSTKCFPCYIENCDICVLGNDYELYCSVCKTGYTFVNGACTLCSSFIPNCEICKDSLTCLNCSSSHFFSYSGNNYTLSSIFRCKLCPVECSQDCTDDLFCTSCSVSYNLIDNHCISELCVDPHCYFCFPNTYCLYCVSGFFHDLSGVCKPCPTNCKTCTSENICTECFDQSFNMRSSNGSLLCLSSCPTDQSVAVDMINRNCQLCSSKYGSKCIKCNDTQCVQCNGTYLIADGSGCTSCKDTNDVKNGVLCYKQPTISINWFGYDGPCLRFYFDCEIYSRFYFSYGPNSSESTALNEIKTKLGNKTFLYDYKNWFGYGYVDLISKNEFHLCSFKNSGESFTFYGFCESKAGGLISSKQYQIVSNLLFRLKNCGGKISIITLVANDSINSINQMKVGLALKETFRNYQVKRDIYSADGKFIPNFSISNRILLQNYSNSSNNSLLDGTNIFQFQIIPEFLLNYENMNTLINITLANSSAFLQTMNQNLAKTNCNIYILEVFQNYSLKTLNLNLSNNIENSDSSNLIGFLLGLIFGLIIGVIAIVFCIIQRRKRKIVAASTQNIEYNTNININNQDLEENTKKETELMTSRATFQEISPFVSEAKNINPKEGQSNNTFDNIQTDKISQSEINKINDAYQIKVQDKSIDNLPESIKKLISKHPNIWISYNIIIFDRNDERSKLGRGAGGSVFKGKLKDQYVAIKEMEINESEFDDNVIQNFCVEIELWYKLNSEFIVPLYGISVSLLKKSYLMVMELAVNGSLRKVLSTNKEMPWHKRLEIALDIVNGINYLHKDIKFIHRDIKSGNVLIDGKLRAKICDFGIAKIKKGNGQTTETMTRLGTTFYMAPELFESQIKYNFSSDIYALGVLLWELLEMDKPGKKFRGKGDVEVIKSIIEEMRKNQLDREIISEESEKKHPKFCEIIRWCWNFDPKKRPNAEQILEKLQKEKEI